MMREGIKHADESGPKMGNMNLVITINVCKFNFGAS